MAINDNARYAFKYLQEKYKLTPARAAGIIGNLMQESGMRTGARNAGDGSDGSDSIGVAQWNGRRARNLHAFADKQGKAVGDLDVQLDFLMHELNGEGDYGGGSERAAYDQLAKADNYTAATKAMIGYERPQGYSADNPTGGHGWKNRHKYAGQIMGLTPDEIASAQAASDELNPQTIEPVTPTTIQPTEATETIKPEEKKGLFGITLPEKILGVETEKGIGALSGLAKLFQDDANTMNQQVARGGRAPSQNIEIAKADTGGLLGGLAGPDGQQPTQLKPWELELMRLRQGLGKQGGLGGLGGIGRYI